MDQLLITQACLECLEDEIDYLEYVVEIADEINSSAEQYGRWPG